MTYAQQLDLCLRLLKTPETTKESLYAVVPDPLRLSTDSDIPDAHPLKRQAVAVYDALEAITNGMQHGEVIEALETIGPESAYYEWKQWIRTLEKFYRGKSILQEIQHLRPGSPLERSLKLFQALETGRTNDLEESDALFLNKLIQEDRFFSDSIEDMQDALTHGYFEVFTTTCFAVIQELKSKSMEKAQQWALWGLRRLIEENQAPVDFISGLNALLGKPEAYRLSAIALFSTDSMAALLYWLQGMLLLIDEWGVMPEARLQPLLGLLSDFTQEARKQLEMEGRDPEAEHSLLNLACGLRDRLIVSHPNLKTAGVSNDGFEMLKEMTDRLLPISSSDRPLKKTTPPPSSHVVKKKPGVQLELFSF